MNCPVCNAENEPQADTCFSCGRNLFSLTKGTVLSERYEIQATLGRGGMGMVYKAYDRKLEETVAIKILRADIAHSPDASKRFRNEIRLARRVRHRNVCAIHEYGQQGQLQYIAMEYLAGTDFKQLLRANGPLPGPEACRVAIQIADALQAIHEVGIVHRDLKTPNIMRDARGVVRLMDFGIAKVFEGDAGSTATGTGLIVGTPEYMSPEQARAEKVDARSDIYALGVVLHELLTGEVPLRGDTPLATLMKHVSEKPAFDSPLLPESLRTILRKALAKNRDERYRSADDIASALRSVLLSSAPTAELAPPARPLAVGKGGALQEEAPPEPQETTPLPTPVPTAVPTRSPTRAGAAGDLAARTHITPIGASQGAASRPPTRAVPTPAHPLWRATVIIPAILAAIGLAWLGVKLQREAAPLPMASAVDAGAPAPVVTLSRPEPVADPPRASAPTPSAEAAILAEPPDRTGLQATAEARRPQSIRPASPPARAEVATTVAVPTPSSAPVPSPEAPAGLLQLGVRPYAEVLIDGRSMGATPMKPMELAAGSHVVRLVHPDYQPIQRRITIRPTETTKLLIDFALDGIAK